MRGFRLYKYEKLCSRTAIDRLFVEGDSAIAFPLRAVWRIADAPADEVSTPAKFLITIPKKKIRKAVGRVLLRRRTREAYRLNRELLIPALKAKGKTAEIAFIYLDKEFADYEVIATKMQTLLSKIADKL